MTLAKPFMRFYGRLSEGHTDEALWEAEALGGRQGALAGPREPVGSPRLKQRKRGARWDACRRSQGAAQASKARGSSGPPAPRLCLRPSSPRPPVASQPPLTTRSPRPARGPHSSQNATRLPGGQRPCGVRVALKALYSLATTPPSFPKLPPKPCTPPPGANPARHLSPQAQAQRRGGGPRPARLRTQAADRAAQRPWTHPGARRLSPTTTRASPSPAALSKQRSFAHRLNSACANVSNPASVLQPGHAEGCCEEVRRHKSTPTHTSLGRRAQGGPRQPSQARRRVSASPLLSDLPASDKTKSLCHRASGVKVQGPGRPQREAPSGL